MTLELFLNILIISLLCVGIIYAIILEQRLSSSKEASRNFSLLLKQFYESSHRLQQEIRQLKHDTQQLKEELAKETADAELIRDELRFLNEKHKTSVFSPITHKTHDISKSPSSDNIRLSQEEQELLEAMRALR